MSFVRIGSFRAKPDQIHELIAIFERDVQPAMRAAEGNVSACLLHQHGEGDTFLACTAWRTREDAERYEKSGLAQENVGKLRHTFAGPPTLATYDGYGG
jgi:heme-degrading monooxygenase HmoA